MSVHLSARQMSDMLAGENNPACQAHLNSCASCEAEFEQLRGSLGHFRNSVRAWSGEQIHETSYAAPGLPFPALRWLALVVVCTLLLATVAIRYSGRSPKNREEPPAPVSDTVLLNEIRLDVSRPVPVTLEPLLMDRTP